MKVWENFFAIDGPNGVGKSTVIKLLKQQFAEHKWECVFSKEPTASSLGNFIRQNQDVYGQHTLAALVAADRYDHIERLIVPSLRSGKIVVTDRSLASSFVYQVQDGLSYEFIKNLNGEIILPSHYFILEASVETITKRLAQRKELTRFETPEKSTNEAALFRKAGEVLQALNVSVHFLENDTSSSEDTTTKIFRLIAQYVKR